MLPTVNEKYFGQAFFDGIVEWVGDNLDPDDVFSRELLVEWAKDNPPEAIFGEEALAEWAFENGYVEEE